MPLQAQVTRYPVQVLTTTLHIQGQMEIIGSPIDYMNDANRDYIPFLEATALLLSGGRLGAITRSQVVVPKPDMVALYIDNPQVASSLRLLKRTELAILYLPNLVCRGEFHLGSETRWQDMLALLVGDFFAVTSATAFSPTPLPGPFPNRADLFILNRAHVHLLHLDQA